MSNNINPFVSQLLSLRQDAGAAISAPSNWFQKPLLNVKTELDPIIDDLYSSMLKTEKASRARWHFFVGSPGNGKSAIVGKLIRKIDAKYKVTFKDENGIDIKKHTVDPVDHIPYVVYMRESKLKYDTAWFAQDASVVKNPFNDNADPADDLLDLLKEAHYKGISLIICANRGVIERAHRKVYTDSSKTCKTWYKVLKHAVEGHTQKGTMTFDNDNKNTIFKDGFDFQTTNLDNKSLIPKGITESLISEATSEKHWTACNKCQFKQVCPFQNNRIWLSNEKAKTNFIKFLTTAEILSGQVIVFREILSLLSFILAGSPHDYGSDTPCEWVAEQVGSSNYFALLHRRIYMSLFSSYAPFGLETENQLREKQLNYLDKIQSTLSDKDEKRATLQPILNIDRWPTTNVGTDRLLGNSGLFNLMDGIKGNIPIEILETWESDYDIIIDMEHPLLCKLEKRCATIWKELQWKIDMSSEHAVEMYWWLRRWTSSITLRLGCLLNSYSFFENELDDLIGVIYSGTSDEKLPTKTRIHIEKEIDKLLGHIDLESRGIAINQYTSLAGNWIGNSLHPEITEIQNKLGLIIRIGSKEEIVISTEVYAWLKRMADQNMMRECFPSHLLEAAKDMRIRAAAQNNYSTTEEQIDINILRPDNSSIKMTRYGDDVILDDND